MNKQCTVCGEERDMLSWETECFPCRQEKHFAQIKDQIVSGEIDSTGYEDEIVCPYCGEIYVIDDNYELYEEGEDEIVCPECNKEFTVETHVSYSFSTQRQDDEDGGDEL